MKVEIEELTSGPDQVLKVWDVESSHKYENNQHISQVKITLTHCKLPVQTINTPHR